MNLDLIVDLPAIETMDASDAYPPEDTVGALLECLVDPLLVGKASMEDPPSESQQLSVANQVHAVVLLYNYYHRKKHPHLEYLGFESFCKLAVDLRPALLSYMKFMQKSSNTELTDPGKQLSLTEKKVMAACDICMSLDASKDLPGIEGWQISKVTVFLVNSKKEKCFLQFGSITQGVWSMIEKATDVTDYSSKGMLEGQHIIKKKRVTKKSSRDGLGADEDNLKQLAFSAVKEAVGIPESDLLIMESHMVYSLSKEKTVARFYIMQCTVPNRNDLFLIPIEDAIGNLQGPLIRKGSFFWSVTPAVDYFHVMPYAGILSDWFSRISQDQRLESGNLGVSEPEGQDGRDKSVKCLRSSVNVEPLEKNDSNGCPVNGLSSSFNGPHNMDVDDRSIVDFRIDDISTNLVSKVQTYNLQKGMNMEDGANATKSGAKDEDVVDPRIMPQTANCRGEEVSNRKVVRNHISSDSVPMVDHARVTYRSNYRNPETVLATIATKEPELSQKALRALLSKRHKLTLQQRNIEDEIAKCDKNINTILNAGEDDLEVKINSIIDGCNDVFLDSVTQDATSLCSLHKYTSQLIKTKRLSEAVLHIHSPCQELDGICYENNWILPTYRVSVSDGGFQAQVSLKGLDFEYSTSGGQQSSPHESRESAAALMLAKLRNLAP